MDNFNNLHCILLVDDDIPTNFIHRKVIQKANLATHVQVATTAREALDFLTATGKFEEPDSLPRPGIIFLDINMPGMNGWDFMDAYRKLNEDQKSGIVVVMLSTSLNPDDRERALKDPDIATFIPKPLRPETVIELAGKYFGQ